MPKRKTQTAVPAVPKASLGARIKKDIIKNYQLYLLMIPGFLLLILFKIGPVGAMVIAFEDFSAAKGVFGSTWVGLENFKRILQDPYIRIHISGKSLKIQSFWRSCPWWLYSPSRLYFRFS